MFKRGFLKKPFKRNNYFLDFKLRKYNKKTTFSKKPRTIKKSI